MASRTDGIVIAVFVASGGYRAAGSWDMDMAGWGDFTLFDVSANTAYSLFFTGGIFAGPNSDFPLAPPAFETAA